VIECQITSGAGERYAWPAHASPDWVQIREKDLSARDLYELIRAALELPNPRGAKFLVNTRVDVALAAGCAGAHLPSGSPPARFWRSPPRGEWIVPPGFLLGVSCHAVEEVRQAEQDGADYVLFGPVFAPLSKSSNLNLRGLEELALAAASVKIPVLALGGITRQNQAACVTAGAAGIAGISLYQTC
jgi:thiamine-phosphate pyrophosphorylase